MALREQAGRFRISLGFPHGNLVVDLAARPVTRDGHEIRLTATEYALLRLLIKHSGRVLTHRHILREIWDRNPSSIANTCAST